MRLLVLGLVGVLGAAVTPARAQGSAFCAAPAARGDDALLSLDLASLLDVKVTTASKFAETLADAPGVMSVVSRDELRRFGGVTVREVLERVPGLTGTTAYFTDRSILAARGDQTKINGGHLLILINGRPTREVLEGGVVSDVLESFPVSILERIEIIKGPGSVLYGSNAFSAVVNLITQRADRNGFMLSGFPGGAGALGSAAQATVACGDLSIVAAAQYHRKPDWRTTYRIPEAFVNDPLAGVQLAVQSALIRDFGEGAYLGVGFKGLNVMSSFTGWHTSSFVRGTVGENRWRRGFADLGYGFKPHAGWDSSVNLTYTRTTLQVPDFPNIGRDSNEAVLEWTNTLSATTRDRVTFGALYNRVAGEEIYFGLGFPLPISQGSRSSGGFYGQVDHRFNPKVKVIGGLQANKIAGVDLNVVPRAGLIWNPVAPVTVKALYSSAFRAPSINETRLNHPGLAGNPALRPETVGTFDLGVAYQGERILAGVTVFRSRQSDSIVVDTSTPRWSYQNLGEATFAGFEFEGKYYAGRHLFVLGSYSYQANEDSNGVENITPVPNTSAKAGVSYETGNGLAISLFDNYQGGLPRYTSTLNPTPTAYHLVSSQVRFDLARFLGADAARSVGLFVRGDNLANRQVWMPDWGGNTGDTIPGLRGRTVYFGIELR
jgi:outer membrane receptor protein involved in Fe transport